MMWFSDAVWDNPPDTHFLSGVPRTFQSFLFSKMPHHVPIKKGFLEALKVHIRDTLSSLLRSTFFLLLPVTWLNHWRAFAGATSSHGFSCKYSLWAPFLQRSPIFRREVALTNRGRGASDEGVHLLLPLRIDVPLSKEVRMPLKIKIKLLNKVILG